MRKPDSIILDSQAPIKALASFEIISKTIWDSLQKLADIISQDIANLVWVSGHQGIA